MVNELIEQMGSCQISTEKTLGGFGSRAEGLLFSEREIETKCHEGSRSGEPKEHGEIIGFGIDNVSAEGQGESQADQGARNSDGESIRESGDFEFVQDPNHNRDSETRHQEKCD